MHVFQVTCWLIFEMYHMQNPKLSHDSKWGEEKGEPWILLNLIQRNDVKALGIKQMHEGSLIKVPKQICTNQIKFHTLGYLRVDFFMPLLIYMVSLTSVVLTA